VGMDQIKDSNESVAKEIIENRANAAHIISEIIAKRWSARAFSPRPVEFSKLLSILEVSRWAPSSRNEQPWRYIVFTSENGKTLKKAQSVLKDINDTPRELQF
jgi:nitroreductase family protein